MTIATIPHLADAAASLFGPREAVVDGDSRVTFAELRERMLAAAAAFVAAGVQAGDRVALWAPNGLRWIEACLGLQAAGAVLVPLNTRFKGAEAQYILNRAKVVLLVGYDDFLGGSARARCSPGSICRRCAAPS